MPVASSCSVRGLCSAGEQIRQPRPYLGKWPRAVFLPRCGAQDRNPASCGPHSDTQLVPSYGTPPHQPAARFKHPQTFFPCQLWGGQSFLWLQRNYRKSSCCQQDTTWGPQQHQGLNGQSTGLRFKCAVEAVLVGREPCVRETWSPSEHHQAPHKALLPLLLPPNLRSRLN